MAPVVVLGGIYGGIFTPTEAAVVAVVYSMFIGTFVYKEMTWKGTYQAFYDAILVNGVVTYMIGLSMAFANLLSMEQVPAHIASVLLSVTDNPFLLLLLINVFLLLVGSLMDNIPSTIILTPILLPIVVELGMSPITFGVMLTMNLAIGFVTPPYGPNLFVASSVAKIPMMDMMVYIKWLLLALIVALMITTYFEPATMFLVRVFG